LTALTIHKNSLLRQDDRKDGGGPIILSELGGTAMFISLVSLEQPQALRHRHHRLMENSQLLRP
jgi:hypothetical protein